MEEEDQLIPLGHQPQGWHEQHLRCRAELTEPARIGPDTAGTGGTGPARYRFRLVSNQWDLKC
jgi:hypothetical protein